MTMKRMLRRSWSSAVLALVVWCLTTGCSRLKTNDSAAASGHASVPDLGPAPEVSFQTLDGKTVNLSDYRGKVVLVNFWATWCEPCRSEIPELIELQRTYGPRGFVVLGVAMDSEGRSAVEPFVKRPQFDVGGQKVAMEYPVVLGNDDVAARFGGIIGLPTTVIISPQGRIVKKIFGPIDAAELRGLLAQLLPG
jgi:thiol-disulfide isomerase/thioredoxin